eukprot:scaffold7046_cov151-Skeletonema_menzelii.AAC.6
MSDDDDHRDGNNNMSKNVVFDEADPASPQPPSSIDNDISSSATTPPISNPSAISTSPYLHKVTARRHNFLHESQTNNNLLERNALKISSHKSKLFLFLWDLYSAFRLFGVLLISMETFVGCALTIGATLLAYYLSPKVISVSDSQWDGTLPTILLSFATVTPLIQSISMAFNRREAALRALASYRSALYHLYMAQASWDWGECGKKGGRRTCVENTTDLKIVQKEGGDDGESEEDSTPSQKKQPIDWLNHADNLLCQLIHLSDSLSQYLALPIASRTHHRATKFGEKEAKTIVFTGRKIFALNTAGRIFMISQLTEALKYRGLPGNEASRIRQWEQYLSVSMENMRLIKEYRTPQSLRLFARVFTLSLPPLYATSFAQIAIDTESIVFGCIIGAVTSLALTSLFEAVRQLEDPFARGFTFDGIDVTEELQVLAYEELMVARTIIFPDAEEFVLKEDSNKVKKGGGLDSRRSRHYCEDSARIISTP